MLRYNQHHQLHAISGYNLESYEPYEEKEEKQNIIRLVIPKKNPNNFFNIQNIYKHNIQYLNNLKDRTLTDINLGNNINNLYSFNNYSNINLNKNLTPLKMNVILNQNPNKSNGYYLLNQNPFGKVPFNYQNIQKKIVRCKSSKFFPKPPNKMNINEKIDSNKIILTSKTRQFSPFLVQKNVIASNKKIVPIYRKIIYRKKYIN